MMLRLLMLPESTLCQVYFHSKSVIISQKHFDALNNIFQQFRDIINGSNIPFGF